LAIWAVFEGLGADNHRKAAKSFEILFVPFVTKPLEHESLCDAADEVGLRLRIVTGVKLLASAIFLFFSRSYIVQKNNLHFKLTNG
jgi:hypothetical protein